MGINLKDTPLIFLDIETTGYSVRTDRIIEIYASKVVEDIEIEDFHTLINPQLELPRNITSITGISYDELLTAPTFNEIANQLYSFLGNNIIIAHNARFDYGFIKREFLNIGLPFNNKYLCTVKLSRKLFPEFKRHGLDRIIERFDVPEGLRHRAKYDTDVIKILFFTSKKMFAQESFEEAISYAMKENVIPNSLNKNFDIKNIKSEPGIYIFYGDNEFPLYVGMSKNVKKRVLDHLYQTQTFDKELAISSQVKDIKTIYTLSEISARILELALVRKLKPMYNRRLKKSIPGVLMKVYVNEDGYLEVSKLNDKDFKDISNFELIYVSGNEKTYEFIATANIKKYGLCSKLLGIEKTKSSCFYHKLGTCKGACTKKISPNEYNDLFYQAYAEYQLPKWDKGTEILEFKGSEYNERFEINDWKIIQAETNYNELLSSIIDAFDINLFNILKSQFK